MTEKEKKLQFPKEKQLFKAILNCYWMIPWVSTTQIFSLESFTSL